MAALVADHIYSNDTPVVFLNASKSFANLTATEQLYAHYLSKASWYGSLIVLYQTSPESPLIWALLRKLFTSEPLESLKNVAQNKGGFGEEDWQAFLVYSAAFYSNFGNYRGYGDSKFVPNLTYEKMDSLVKNSTAWTQDRDFMEFVWNKAGHAMFSLEKNQLSLGFAPNGTTTYWSKNMTQEDEAVVKKFLEENDISPYNTRALKDPTTGEYIIRFASILGTSDSTDRDYLDKQHLNQTQPDSSASSAQPKFRLERGDYSPLLQIMTRYLAKAKSKAHNSTESSMLEMYIKHFTSGNLAQHKEGSRYWIANKSPAVETYIGFIENYRDPAGQRAEFEGFVTMVDREISKKFTDLVNNAPELLGKLPWPKEFEKDRFLQPDFTSLDVLTFCSSGIPIGINIPNYEEIRQNEGFKNVNLGNVISTLYKNRNRNFVKEEDDAFLEKYAISSVEIITGLHELLGHGSGKLLKAVEGGDKGEVNFDKVKTVNPLTGKVVEKWYDAKESYDSKFGSLSSAYEECRAEGIAHYLCFEPKVLQIFGYISSAEIGHLLVATFFELILAGLESLKMYSPSSRKWLQAHSQANFVLLRVLMESSECRELIKIELVDDAEGKPDLQVHFARDPIQIKAKCRKALGDFLLKLQIYKSTGDLDAATALFSHYSTVSDDAELPYLRFREISVARKKPRRLLVQTSTMIEDDGSVVLKSYEGSCEGLIESMLDHFGEELVEGEVIEKIMVELWKKDEANWW